MRYFSRIEALNALIEIFLLAQPVQADQHHWLAYSPIIVHQLWAAADCSLVQRRACPLDN